MSILTGYLVGIKKTHELLEKRLADIERGLNNMDKRVKELERDVGRMININSSEGGCGEEKINNG